MRWGVGACVDAVWHLHWVLLPPLDSPTLFAACLTLLCVQVLFGFVLIGGREAIARYGNWLGAINTGAELDFAIAKSTTASSATGYRTE